MKSDGLFAMRFDILQKKATKSRSNLEQLQRRESNEQCFIGQFCFPNASQQSVQPTPGKVRRDYSGGTAARRDGVRVFGQFAWLEVGSAKAAMSRPAHQYPAGA